MHECLQWSQHTSQDWRSFCSEVIIDCLKNQQPTGGEGVVVEIDDTFFEKRKYEQGKILVVFGCLVALKD